MGCFALYEKNLIECFIKIYSLFNSELLYVRYYIEELVIKETKVF